MALRRQGRADGDVGGRGRRRRDGHRVALAAAGRQHLDDVVRHPGGSRTSLSWSRIRPHRAHRRASGGRGEEHPRRRHDGAGGGVRRSPPPSFRGGQRLRPEQHRDRAPPRSARPGRPPGVPLRCSAPAPRGGLPARDACGVRPRTAAGVALRGDEPARRRRPDRGHRVRGGVAHPRALPGLCRPRAPAAPRETDHGRGGGGEWRRGGLHRPGPAGGGAVGRLAVGHPRPQEPPRPPARHGRQGREPPPAPGRGPRPRARRHRQRRHQQLDGRHQRAARLPGRRALPCLPAQAGPTPRHTVGPCSSPSPSPLPSPTTPPVR